jgi:hypothetical protein
MTTKQDIETWAECARYWRWFIGAATPRQFFLEMEKALINAKRGDFDLAFGLLENIPPERLPGLAAEAWRLCSDKQRDALRRDYPELRGV